jgi:hypothetical protein
MATGPLAWKSAGAEMTEADSAAAAGSGMGMGMGMDMDMGVLADRGGAQARRAT